MSLTSDVPTCEMGFWLPAHAGCPQCGPNGPCVDPEYEALIQATAERRRFRRLLAAACAIVALIWVVL